MEVRPHACPAIGRIDRGTQVLGRGDREENVEIAGLKAAHGYNHSPIPLERSDSATPGVGRSPLIPGEGKRTGCSWPGGS